MVVVLTAGAYLSTVLHIDPFAGLKKAGKEIDPSLGVRIQNATIVSFDGDKLVTKANVDRLDVRSDKQVYDLFGVHDGVFYSTKGALQFDSPRGQWNVTAHELDAPMGAHVKDKNVDLNVPKLAFKSPSGVVSAPGTIKGKLFGGDIQANGVRYNVNSGAFRAGPAQWNGALSLSFQEGEKPATRTWNIKNLGETYTKPDDPDVIVYEKGMGSDGDIIVMADVIEQNRKTDVLVATGNVRYFSSKTDMVCEKAVIDRKEKKATLMGKVEMLFKAKEKQDTISADDGIPPYRPLVPDEIAKNRPRADASGQTEEQKKLDDEIRSGKNMHDYPTVCYAEKVDYWYKRGSRHAEITGNPQARQEFPDGRWRHAWTKTAYYDGEKERLKLVSTDGKMDTRMINSIGDDVVTTWFDASTKDGDESWRSGPMTGQLMDYSDEIPRDERKKPDNSPTKTGTTGGSTGTGTTGGGTTGGGGGSTGGHGGQKPAPLANRTKPALNGRIGGAKSKSR